MGAKISQHLFKRQEMSHTKLCKKLRLILNCQTFEVFQAKMDGLFKRKISKQRFAWQY